MLPFLTHPLRMLTTAGENANATTWCPMSRGSDPSRGPRAAQDPLSLPLLSLCSGTSCPPPLPLLRGPESTLLRADSCQVGSLPTSLQLHFIFFWVKIHPPLSWIPPSGSLMTTPSDYHLFLLCSVPCRGLALPRLL